jgi:hypothetical protein
MLFSQESIDLRIKQRDEYEPHEWQWEWYNDVVEFEKGNRDYIEILRDPDECLEHVILGSGYKKKVKKDGSIVIKDYHIDEETGKRTFFRKKWKCDQVTTIFHKAGELPVSF